MGDKQAAGNLPPGFRFFPTDEELVVHFLYRKAALLPCHPDIIPSLDLRRYDPWELSGKAFSGGSQWYFFDKRGYDMAASPSGFWKIVGEVESVMSQNRAVGIKKSMAFYIGEGIETNWMMYEYHLVDSSFSSSSSSSNKSSSRRSSKKRAQHKLDFNIWVLCRVFETSCGSQKSFYINDGTELSCLDEVFLSLDDLDEISLPETKQILFSSST